MAQLYSVINAFKYRNHNRSNIAGYINTDPKGYNTFYYYESSNPSLPAAINMLQDSYVRRGNIYTNLPKGHWIRTYKSKQIWYKEELTKGRDNNGSLHVKPVELIPKPWPPRLAPSDVLVAPRVVGLYDTAKQMMDGTPEPATGLGQALRYYMLAAYALLDISEAYSFEGLGNYVAALMVSETGEILASGINTGSYRHAEVSMLVDYFRKVSTATKFPKKTIVFSTLTPCKQCTDYLRDTMPIESVIYFGQEDTGKKGRVGKAISSAMSEKTSAPYGRSKTHLSGSGAVGSGTVSGIYSVKMAHGLTSCTGSGGSIASQVGHAGDSREILSSASRRLIHETMNAGDDDTAKVLRYLTGWLGTINPS